MTTVTTLSGDTTTLDHPVDELDRALDGELIRADDDGYDDARALWNGLIDRRPALIARCAGVTDVQRTVRHRQRPARPAARRLVRHLRLAVPPLTRGAVQHV